MKKKSIFENTCLEPTFLLAGTAIGSGMISLPIVLAKFGLICTLFLVLGFAVLTYFSALVRSDLNLNTDASATLTEVGNAFGCHYAGTLGDGLFHLLSFSLLAAYISGGASMLQTLCPMSTNASILCFGGGITLAFLFATKILVKINKVCFLIMFILLILIIGVLFLNTRIHAIPLQCGTITFSDIVVMIPILFTSFGFQGSIHSMTKLCHNDRGMIRKACFWGSIIPAVLYLFWVLSILIIIASAHPEFFSKMLHGAPVEVGELMQVLGQSTALRCLDRGLQIVSFFALLTSIFGVGLAVKDWLQRELNLNPLKSICFTVWIPAVIAALIPNAFIKILSFAGIILAMIALVLPVYISWHMQHKFSCKVQPMVHSRLILTLLGACGLGIIALGSLG